MFFFLFSGASSLKNSNFVYCIDSYPLSSENILTSNHANEFDFLLNMFQDKYNRSGNCDYFQCIHCWIHCAFAYS